jgi:hypothetical protein
MVLGFIHIAFGHQLHVINDVAYMWTKGGRQHLHGDATVVEARASDSISCIQFLTKYYIAGLFRGKKGNETLV